MNKETKLSIMGFVALVFIIGLPLGVIWSINTLFALDIMYRLETWFAALVLIMIFGRNGKDLKDE